jgi:hypothetical protein
MNKNEYGRYLKFKRQFKKSYDETVQNARNPIFPVATFN